MALNWNTGFDLRALEDAAFDNIASECRFAGCPRTGGAVQDVHVTPDYGPWKQTFSRSTTDWTQHGDLPRLENNGDRLWKRQIYENAKRKDSSRMEAQIIRYENAKDKKL